MKQIIYVFFFFFCYFNSVGHFVHRCRTVFKLALLIEGHLSNILIKFECNQPRKAFRKFSMFSSGGHILYRSETVLAILEEACLSNISMKFE